MKENKNNKNNNKNGKKSFKNKLMKIGGITMVSAMAFATSGSIAYFSAGVIDRNNNADDTTDDDTPIIDNNTPNEETAFSKTLNNLMSASDIYIDRLALNLYVGGYSSPVMLSFESLAVDLSSLSETIINMTTDLRVQYGSLDQRLSMGVGNVFDDGSATSSAYTYITIRGKAYRFNVWHNLADLLNILKAVGLTSLPSMSFDSVNLSAILSTVTSSLGAVTATETPNSDGSYTFNVSLSDITVTDTVSLKNLALTMTADSEYQLTSISVGSTSSPLTIAYQESEDSTANIIQLTLGSELRSGNEDGQAIVLNGGNYTGVSKEYTDVTDANESILSTIANIFSTDGEGGLHAKGNVGLEIDMDNVTLDANNAYTKASDFLAFDGKVQFDATNITSGFSNSQFYFELNNLGNKSAALDTVKATFDSNKDVYLNYNDSIKGVIKDSTSSAIIEEIGSWTNSTMVTSLANALNISLSSLDFDSLVSNDSDGIESMLQGIMGTVYDKTGDVNSIINALGFEYSLTTETTGTFKITIPYSILGLGTSESEEAITIECNVVFATDTTDGYVKDIKVSGILIGEIMTSVTLTLNEYDSTTAYTPTDASDYTDFSGTVGIFKSLGDFLDTAQARVNYSMNVTTTSDSALTRSFAATGDIGLDLTGVLTSLNGNKSESSVTSKLLNSMQDGAYYLTFNLPKSSNYSSEVTTNGAIDHSVDVFYQDKKIYFGYNSVFKNYIETEDVGQMMTIVNQKSSVSNASSSFDIVSSILSYLSENVEFSDDIKAIKNNHELNLDSFLSIENGTDESGNKTTDLVITLNISNVFAGTSWLTKIQNITITLDTDTNTFNSLSIKGGFGDVGLNVTLNFEEYKSYQELNNLKNLDAYQEIVDVNSIFNSFYNLPTDLKKYGIKIDADMRKFTSSSDTTGSSLVSIGGGLKVDTTDTTNTIYGGNMTVTHPSIESLYSDTDETADQTVLFNYQSSNSELVAQYNTGMHLRMNTGEMISDIFSIVNSAREKDLLLLNYLSTAMSAANSLSLTTIIQNKAYDILLDNELIYDVDFNDEANTITILIDRTIFGSLDNVSEDDRNKNAVKLVVSYDDSDEDNAELTSISVSTTMYSTDADGKETGESTSISASIALDKSDEIKVPTEWDTIKDYRSNKGNNNILAYNNDTKDYFIDLNGFTPLIKCGVDTSEYNTFDISGNVNLDLGANLDGLSLKFDDLSFNLGIDLSIMLVDEKPIMYVSVISDTANAKQAGEEGYRATEFFIDLNDNDAYYSQTTTDDNEVTTSKNYKTSLTNIKDNIAYYALTEVLDIDSRPAGKTLMGNLFNELSKVSADSTVEVTTDGDDTTVTDTTSEETTDQATSGSTSTGSSILDQINIGLTNDFSYLISSAVHDEANKKFSIVFNPNSLFNESSDENKVNVSDVLTFGTTEIDLYYRNMRDATTNEVVATPFYGISFETSIGLLPYAAATNGTTNLIDVDLYGSFTCDAATDMGKVTAENLKAYRDGTETPTVMSRYFEYVLAYEKAFANSEKYAITGYSYKYKEGYDFTNWELTKYINSYEVVGNSSAIHSITYSGTVITDGTSVFFKM